MLNRKYDATIDYFAILGVHRDASEKAVKAAYRKLARRYHPDVSKIHDATSKFQEIAEAYEVLKKHREAYCKDWDRLKGYKHASTKQSQHKAQSSSRGQETPKYTRTDRRKQKPINGKDRTVTYPLTLRYAIRLLKIGSFYLPGLKANMKFTREALAGKTFRLEGKGYSGLFGGKTGDFLVKFEVKSDPGKWHLKGADIYATYKVSPKLIKPGHQFSLDSPSGNVQLTVPSNYKPAEYILVANMGLPAEPGVKAGDLYAKLIAA